jgi:type VI secretion system protein ImpM
MTTGVYGKLASRGDFISRSLPHSFIQPWDAWLAAGLLASQEQLGGQWLDAYLVSPLWRFAVAADVCGPAAVAGVLMPSIDRVGRYFPLTIAQTLDPAHSLGAVVCGPDDWFEQAESVLLSTLETGASFEDFDQRLQALARLPVAASLPRRSIASLQRSPATSPAERNAVLLEKACEGASLWWGKGSEQIAPGLLHCAGLPAAADFCSFLLGPGASQ